MEARKVTFTAKPGTFRDAVRAYKKYKEEKEQRLERKLTMGVYLVALTVGVPCALFLLYCLTPKGKHWLRVNGML